MFFYRYMYSYAHTHIHAHGYTAFHSPYYNASHVQFRAAMREWVEEHVVPYVSEWSEANKVPQSLLKEAYKAGWFPALVDPHKWHTEYAGQHIIGGIKPHQYDAFHNYIVHDELGRIGAGGIVAALGGGMRDVHFSTLCHRHLMQC